LDFCVLTTSTIFARNQLDKREGMDGRGEGERREQGGGSREEGAGRREQGGEAGRGQCHEGDLRAGSRVGGGGRFRERDRGRERRC
jgi:hypothetical protein